MVRTDLERARALAAEARDLLEHLGHGIPAAHIQLALDLVREGQYSFNLRDERTPWDRPLEKSRFPHAGEAGRGKDEMVKESDVDRLGGPE